MIWRWLAVVVGGLLIGLTMAGLGILAFDALSAHAALRADGPLAPIAEALPILETALVLAGIACGLALMARLVLKRSFLSLLTTATHFRWGLFGLGLVLFGGLQVAAVGLTVGFSAPFSAWSVYPSPAALLFCLAALIFYVPTVVAEEVVFRSWILAKDTSPSRRNIVAVLLSGAVFGVAHLQTDPLLVALHLSSGLAYAWAAMRLGGVEFAIGAHLAKNTVLAVMLGVPGRHVWGDEFALTVGVNIAASAALIGAVELVRRRRAV